MSSSNRLLPFKSSIRISKKKTQTKWFVCSSIDTGLGSTGATSYSASATHGGTCAGAAEAGGRQVESFGKNSEAKSDQEQKEKTKMASHGHDMKAARY